MRNSRRDTDTTPEGEAGPSRTCMKKQVCRTEWVPLRCRVGLGCERALKTLYLKHTHALTKTAAKITQACMHRVIQWLRAQYAQTKERKKSQDFLVICKRSDPVQNQWNCPISLWSISLTNLRRQGEVVVSAGDTEFGNWMYFVILLPFGWRSAVILSSTPPLYGVHFKTSSGSGFSIRPQMKRYKVSEKALSHSHQTATWKIVIGPKGLRKKTCHAWTASG